jgi:GNAT superfamily N-acetyltransferase
MIFGAFRRDSPMRHGLGRDYVLVSAPERAFGIHYAIYRNVNPEFDEFLDYGADLEGLQYCFWVLHGGQKIGGIILRPNHIEGLFLSPPHTDAQSVLQAALPLLRSWSDPAKAIEAVDIMPHELLLYQAMGFTLAGSRRVYIRPTETFAIEWAPSFRITTPSPGHVAEVAALFELAYREYPKNADLGNCRLPHWLARTTPRLDARGVPEVFHQASSLVYEKTSDRLVGACLVRPNPSRVRPDICYPKVVDIGVHPEWRRRGLASTMLRKALTALHGEFPILKFGVAVGNAPAEACYVKLGFLPGIVHQRLVLQPAETSLSVSQT